MNQEAIRSIELSTESLFELIESKLHFLNEMQAMSLAQTDLVSQHDMTGLMTLFSRKQELMGALGKSKPNSLNSRAKTQSSENGRVQNVAKPAKRWSPDAINFCKN